MQNFIYITFWFWYLYIYFFFMWILHNQSLLWVIKLRGLLYKMCIGLLILIDPNTRLWSFMKVFKLEPNHKPQSK